MECFLVLIQRHRHHYLLTLSIQEPAFTEVAFYTKLPDIFTNSTGGTLALSTTLATTP